MGLGLHLQTCLKFSAIFISTLLISQEALTMLCGLGPQDYETRNFLEIENNLIRLVLTTCTLKSHREFKRNSGVTTYVQYVIFVAHHQSRYCRSRLRVMCRRESRENLKEENDQK